MVLEENTIKVLKIKTGLKFFSSIFERVYVLEIHNINKERKMAQVILKSYDKTQSNKKIQNTLQILIEDNEISIASLIDNKLKFKPFISELAITYDKSLQLETSCPHRRKSIFKILNILNENVNTFDLIAN